jgi:hypothetical protein
VKLAVLHVPLFILDGFDHHLGKPRLAKVQRTSVSGVEKAVHRQEGLAGSGRRRKSAVRREAAMQTPGEEDGLPDGVIVRQAATMESGHEEKWAVRENILCKVGRPIENRPQITNLPHN